MVMQNPCLEDITRSDNLTGHNYLANGAFPASSSATTDPRYMASNVPPSVFNNHPLSSCNTFQTHESSQDANIGGSEGLQEFDFPSINGNMSVNTYVWGPGSTINSTNMSGVASRYIPVSHSTTVPTQDFQLPRSHLEDEATAFSAIQPSLARAAGMQKNNAARLTHDMDQPVLSQGSALPSFALSNIQTLNLLDDNQQRDSHHDSKAPRHSFPLHGNAFPRTTRSVINTKIGQNNHLFSSFEAIPGSSKRVPTRSSFDPEKRSIVASTRKKGACMACRARKVEVSQMNSISDSH